MIEIERCPKCNANLAIVGRSHRCVPMPEWAGGVPKNSGGGDRSEHAAKVAGKSKALEAARPNPAGVASSPPDAKFDRAAYQREYMRKRRAAAKLNVGQGSKH